MFPFLWGDFRACGGGCLLINRLSDKKTGWDRGEPADVFSYCFPLVAAPARAFCFPQWRSLRFMLAFCFQRLRAVHCFSSPFIYVSDLEFHFMPN